MKFLRVCDQITDNIRINTSAYGNLSLLAPYFRLALVMRLNPGQLPGWPVSSPASWGGICILYIGIYGVWTETARNEEEYVEAN